MIKEKIVDRGGADVVHVLESVAENSPTIHVTCVGPRRHGCFAPLLEPGW